LEYELDGKWQSLRRLHVYPDPIRSTTLKLLVFLARFLNPAEQQSRARQQADI
jgi:hypothetical protein